MTRHTQALEDIANDPILIGLPDALRVMTDVPVTDHQGTRITVIPFVIVTPKGFHIGIYDEISHKQEAKPVFLLTEIYLRKTYHYHECRKLYITETQPFHVEEVRFWNGEAYWRVRQ